MYPHWDANLLVVAVTVVAVAAAVLVHYEGLVTLSRWLAERHDSQRRRKVLFGIFGVLALHITEIWIFGLAIWAVLHYPETGSVSGIHQLGLFDSVYLSAATFTTVGFGDLAPVGPIRFLSGTTALTGFVLITWSASFTFLEMERFWKR
jgi:predicted membrane protein